MKGVLKLNTNSITEKFAQIESQLNGLLATDKRSWVEIYKLMDEVEKEHLYSSKYHSYTAWVNSLAANNHIHVSLLWSRKKAGKVYAAYIERAKQQGISVPSLTAAAISPDSLNLIEKIAGSNTDVTDDLIQKVLQNDLSRKDLKNAWATVRAAQGTTVRKTRYDKDNANVSADAITAKDIVLALSDRKWLPDRVEGEKYESEKYKLFTEFAIQTGSSRNARRIDALILENLTIEHQRNYHLHIHAIEIKVSKNDLIRDEKMQEYCDFADFFWLAVPESLENEAKKIIIAGWGILVISTTTSHIKVAIKAEHNPGIFREQTIESALVKAI